MPIAKPNPKGKVAESVKPQPLPKGMSIASKTTDSAISKAEAMYSDMIRKGTPISKARAATVKKTGIYPNGGTN